MSLSLHYTNVTQWMIVVNQRVSNSCKHPHTHTYKHMVQALPIVLFCGTSNHMSEHVLLSMAEGSMDICECLQYTFLKKEHSKVASKMLEHQIRKERWSRASQAQDHTESMSHYGHCASRSKRKISLANPSSHRSQVMWLHQYPHYAWASRRKQLG